jgi:hypothetical protein
MLRNYGEVKGSLVEEPIIQIVLFLEQTRRHLHCYVYNPGFTVWRFDSNVIDPTPNDCYVRWFLKGNLPVGIFSRCGR